MTKLIMRDVKTGKEYSIDFTYVAFPAKPLGSKMGYRVEGFCEMGKTKSGISYGDMKEFGTLIIDNGKLKIIQW